MIARNVATCVPHSDFTHIKYIWIENYHSFLKIKYSPTTVSLRRLRHHREPLGHNQEQQETNRNQSTSCPDSTTRTSLRRGRSVVPVKCINVGHFNSDCSLCPKRGHWITSNSYIVVQLSNPITSITTYIHILNRR